MPLDIHLAYIAAVGLSSVIAAMAWLFDWLRWAGARKRIRLVSRVSGGFLIGGGIWLALTRGR